MRGATYLSQGEARTRRQQFPRNTDEDLDPTFKSKETEPPAEVFASCSQAAQSHTVPVDSLFDYQTCLYFTDQTSA
ncbi:unnamed protein product [Caretta caretta]